MIIITTLSDQMTWEKMGGWGKGWGWFSRCHSALTALYRYISYYKALQHIKGKDGVGVVQEIEASLCAL